MKQPEKRDASDMELVELSLEIEELDDRSAPEYWCSCTSTSCSCTSTSCIVWEVAEEPVRQLP